MDVPSVHLRLNAHLLGRCARWHWAVENQRHWVLHVAFNEDANQVRATHSQANLCFTANTPQSPQKGYDYQWRPQVKRKQANWKTISYPKSF